MKVASNQGVLRYFVSNQGVLYNFTLLRFTKENIPYLGLASEISLAFSLESENFCQQNDCIFLFKKVPLSVRTNAFWLMEAGLGYLQEWQNGYRFTQTLSDAFSNGMRVTANQQTGFLQQICHGTNVQILQRIIRMYLSNT